MPVDRLGHSSQHDSLFDCCIQWLVVSVLQESSWSPYSHSIHYQIQYLIQLVRWFRIPNHIICSYCDNKIKFDINQNLIEHLCLYLNLHAIESTVVTIIHITNENLKLKLKKIEIIIIIITLPKSDNKITQDRCIPYDVIWQILVNLWIYDIQKILYNI